MQPTFIRMLDGSWINLIYVVAFTHSDAPYQTVVMSTGHEFFISNDTDVEEMLSRAMCEEIYGT